MWLGKEKKNVWKEKKNVFYVVCIKFNRIEVEYYYNEWYLIFQKQIKKLNVVIS